MLLSATGTLAAGIILGGIAHKIELIPGLLALVPALMNMRGCISGPLAMRIGTAFHLGLLEGRAGREEIKRNVYASLILTVATAVLVGVLADALCRILGLPSAGLVVMVGIALSVAILASLVMILLTVAIAIYSAAKGLDPDNITIPLVTTMGDAVTMMCLVLALVLLGFI